MQPANQYRYQSPSAQKGAALFRYAMGTGAALLLVMQWAPLWLLFMQRLVAAFLESTVSIYTRPSF
jgi:hypothetical protein